MKLEVTQDSPAGEEGTAHAGHELPVMKITRAVGLWHVISLLDQLTIDFIAEAPEIMAGLKDALDNGDRVRH